MSFPAIRARVGTSVAILLVLGGLAGCGSDGGGTAALPPSDGTAPPALPKQMVGPDGRPKDSNPDFDSARGAKPPR